MRRVQLGMLLFLMIFLLGACDQLEDLNARADVSQIEQAELYNTLQDTVAQVQVPVLFIGLVNLLGGWKLGRVGLAVNGFTIGGLLIYSYLKQNGTVEDENTLRIVAGVGGVGVGVVAFFLYNLMALIIGGAIGTTLMGGTWLQVVENVPPQLLVFITTFVSALVMFVVFRLFLVAFSAVIGAVLLMQAVPYESLWVLPVAGVGILIQSGIAWWIQDDIFGNLRGDLSSAMWQSFGEVLGPFGWLREHQREAAPRSPLQVPKLTRPASAPHSTPAQHQARQQPPQGQYNVPSQQQGAYRQAPPPPQQNYQQPPPPQYAPPQQQNYQQPPPPQYAPPQQQQSYQQPPAPPPPQAVVPPVVPLPVTQVHNAVEQTQPSLKFAPEMLQLILSDGRSFALEGVQMSVGRNPDNAIVVNDPQVSGHHLIISIQPEGVVIWDNNSTNGTLLNGALLKGSHRLTLQDVVQLGAVTLQLAKRSDA